YPVPGHRRGGSADRRRAGSFRVRGGGTHGPARSGPPSDLHGTAAFRRHVAGVLVGASYRAVAGVLSPWRSKSYESATDMLSQRPELADSLITHRFPIKDAGEAFPVAADKSSGA